MYEIECKETEERDAFQRAVRELAPAFNNTQFENDTGIDDDTPIVQLTTTRQTWDRYKIEQLVNMYVASLAIGKPHLSLTNPQQPHYNCICQNKRTKTVTLYMMCGKKY